MKIILLIIPLVSILAGVINGRMEMVSSAILSRSGDAVTLALSICGIMCFWCGLMRVAEASGLVGKLSGILSPLIGVLFRGLKKEGKAFGLISMNIAANLLGLGNASTPLGIKAMKAIAEENACGKTADDNMIMLAVINTASIQIVPATAAALRADCGAAQPMDILPCVWIVSIYGAAVAVLSAKLMARISRRRNKCN